METNKNIIINFLKNKNNENEVIEYLKEQNKFYNNNPTKFVNSLDDEYINLLLNLIKNSTGKVKYHALIVLSKTSMNFNQKNFEEMCKLAIINSSNEDGNIRYASRILLNCIDNLLFLLPFAKEFSKFKIKDTDIFYDFFKDMFYKLYDKYNQEENTKIKESLSKSLSLLLPRIYDIATFDNNKEELEIIKKLTLEGVKWKPIKTIL